METTKLTKKDWKLLNELRLVDGEGNGFANTTQKFDNKIICLASRFTYIFFKRTLYAVKYVSGCFYPLWTKANVVLTKEDLVYEVSKSDYSISRLKID